MQFSISLSGNVMKKLDNASPKVRGIFADAIRDGSTAVMEETIREAPASTGTLRKGIRRELDESKLRAEIYPSTVYGEDLHGPFEGGGSHSAPKGIPAKEAKEGGSLYRWAKKKGINPWAVRASIAKKGVRYNKYMKRAAQNTSGQVQRIFNDAIDRVANYLGD